jgi:hypothetical protein
VSLYDPKLPGIEMNRLAVAKNRYRVAIQSTWLNLNAEVTLAEGVTMAKGIDEILKLEQSAAKFIEVGADVVQEIANWRRLVSPFRLLGLLFKLGPEFLVLKSLDIAEFKAEIADLDGLEKQLLVSAFQKDLDLENDSVEAVFENSVGLIVEAAGLVQEFVKVAEYFVAKVKGKQV